MNTLLGKVFFVARRVKGHWQFGGARQVLNYVIAGLQQLRGDAFFNGTGVAERYCSCCNWQGYRFRPYIAGGYTTLDAACPRCGSHARHRGHIIYYRDHVDLFAKTGKLLYFAPETGILEHLRNAPSLDVVTTDYEETKDVDLQFDIMNIPLPDDSFDFIICHRVIEHVPDDRKAMNELYRILKPGGLAIISVPISNNRENTIEFGKPNPLCDMHYYDYGLDFKARIPARFETQELIFSSLFDRLTFTKLALLEDRIFECRKPLVNHPGV